MAWRAAKSLLVLQEQLKRGSRAAPPATSPDEWGLIGDAAHDPNSDHSPHDFAGWGNDIVTAADFPNRPDLGLDAHQVLDDIRRSRDQRAKYGISNGQIFSNHSTTESGNFYPAWSWRPYNPKGGDRHFTHGHLSVVGDSRADGTQPWTTIGSYYPSEEDEDMGSSTTYDIRLAGFTSLNIAPVNDGAADPRSAWFNLNNDTGYDAYAVRVYISKGQTDWAPLPGFGNDGLLKLVSGQRVSVNIPDFTSCVSIRRQAIDPDGRIVEPTEELPAYAGHLTCCIERGPVRH
jgi:hypothetical protein